MRGEWSYERDGTRVGWDGLCQHMDWCREHVRWERCLEPATEKRDVVSAGQVFIGTFCADDAVLYEAQIPS